jgi:PAS domain S-box-containing protein
MSSGVAMYEAIDDGEDFMFTDFNPTAEKIEKISRKEILGKRVTEVFPGVKSFKIFEVFQRVWQTGKPEYFSPNIYRDERDPGSWRESWVFKLPTGEIVAIYNDITERKKTEHELLESKSLIESIVENVPLMIFLKEATDLRFVVFNRAGEELLGYDRQALLGKNNLDLFPPEQAANFMAKDREVLDGKQGMLDIPEEPILTARKGQRLLHTRKVCIRGSDGVTKYLLGISEDITERQLAEDALKNSEQRYRELAESISDVFFALDKDLRYTFWNKASEELTRIPSKDALGKSLNEVFPDNESTKIVKTMFLRAMETKQPQHFTVQYPGEENVIHEISAYPTEEGVSAFTKDITERNKIEESLKASEKSKTELLNRLNDTQHIAIIGSWDWDLKTNQVWWSDETYSIFGVTREDYVPDFVSNGKFIYPDDFLTYNKTYEHSFQTGEPLDFDTRLITNDGKTKHCNIKGKLIYDNAHQPVHFMGTIIDITERKRMEDKLFEMEALKLTNQAKSELLANVSHELRTPLASIKGFIETLIETDVKWSKKQQMDFLQSANRQADRLTLLIKDLLDMSRLDSGKLTLDKRFYPVNEILDSVSGVLSVIAEKRKLKIVKAPDLPSIHADKGRIGQVITNLVENATKFSEEGSPIVVEVKVLNENVIFSVDDSGIGMPPEVVAKLFDRFYQAQEIVSGKTQGTGLGLSICKGIVEAHGGRIWVEGKTGKGSKFSFSIPVNNL